MEVLKALDALRRDEPFEGFCETLAALEHNAPNALDAVQTLSEARDAANSVKAADFAEKGIAGISLGNAIEALQIERLTALLK